MNSKLDEVDVEVAVWCYFWAAGESPVPSFRGFFRRFSFFLEKGHCDD